MDIPRPPNAFIIYRAERERLIRAQRQALDIADKPKASDLSKDLGAAWRAEPPEVKEKYRLLAEKAREEHKRDYPDYKYKPCRNKGKGSGKKGAKASAKVSTSTAERKVRMSKNTTDVATSSQSSVPSSSLSVASTSTAESSCGSSISSVSPPSPVNLPPPTPPSSTPPTTTSTTDLTVSATATSATPAAINTAPQVSQQSTGTVKVAAHAASKTQSTQARAATGSSSTHHNTPKVPGFAPAQPAGMQARGTGPSAFDLLRAQLALAHHGIGGTHHRERNGVIPPYQLPIMFNPNMFHHADGMLAYHPTGAGIPLAPNAGLGPNVSSTTHLAGRAHPSGPVPYPASTHPQSSAVARTGPASSNSSREEIPVRPYPQNGAPIHQLAVAQEHHVGIQSSTILHPAAASRHGSQPRSQPVDAGALLDSLQMQTMADLPSTTSASLNAAAMPTLDPLMDMAPESVWPHELDEWFRLDDASGSSASFGEDAGSSSSAFGSFSL
ncbi:hypothetical protein C8Q76DRAFT_794992 [Earliella scabrosa]|nr:hypothetical protein C8Q76DRAFT_794992 [Earliella scabrosa]